MQHFFYEWSTRITVLMQTKPQGGNWGGWRLYNVLVCHIANPSCCSGRCCTVDLIFPKIWFSGYNLLLCSVLMYLHIENDNHLSTCPHCVNGKNNPAVKKCDRNETESWKLALLCEIYSKIVLYTTSTLCVLDVTVVITVVCVIQNLLVFNEAFILLQPVNWLSRAQITR